MSEGTKFFLKVYVYYVSTTSHTNILLCIKEHYGLQAD